MGYSLFKLPFKGCRTLTHDGCAGPRIISSKHVALPTDSASPRSRCNCQGLKPGPSSLPRRVRLKRLWTPSSTP
uniref:Uncharacterized protein n=1 Tax=Arundo donax TaxID=35708 RepID=A0A0A8Z2C7_ARUDO